jgi:hypothetical protein
MPMEHKTSVIGPMSEMGNFTNHGSAPDSASKQNTGFKSVPKSVH